VFDAIRRRRSVILFAHGGVVSSRRFVASFGRVVRAVARSRGRSFARSLASFARVARSRRRARRGLRATRVCANSASVRSVGRRVDAM